MKRETLACKTQNRTSGFPYTPKSLPAGQIVVNLVLSGRRLELVGKVWHWEVGRPDLWRHRTLNKVPKRHG
jgi:hypothetical protein